MRYTPQTEMEEFNQPQVVHLHYSNILDWLQQKGLVTSRPGSYGGSGQDVVDIDIQFAKLHFTENKVSAVPDEISALVRSDITYLDAQAVFKFLEQSEGRGSARNMFGLFNSAAIKSWWTLLRSWENGNLHIQHAVNILVQRLGVDEPNLERKHQAAEKIIRTIDNRLIELQRASLSYDRAYSEERKAWKKSTKERGYESSDLEIDDVNDLNKIYCELVNDISAYKFTSSMDYIFAFSKYAAQGSRTMCNDYQSVYKCLRSLNAIPSATEKIAASSSHDSIEVSGVEGLECHLRDEAFSQELLLELTGLRAFFNEKLNLLADIDDPGEQNSQSGSSISDVDIFSYLKFTDAVVLKLKNLRRVLLFQRHQYTGMKNSVADQVQLLRERAVKYRTIFEELKLNRQDVACSLQRYATEAKSLRESCAPLKLWLDEELSKLTDASVTIRYG